MATLGKKVAQAQHYPDLSSSNLYSYNLRDNEDFIVLKKVLDNFNEECKEANEKQIKLDDDYNRINLIRNLRNRLTEAVCTSNKK